MLLYIALGGLVGTLSRYGLQGWVQDRLSGGTFPAGTLVVNVAGSLAIGFLIRYGTGSALFSPEMRAGLTIGFCGAFTTMSTFAYESQARRVVHDRDDRGKRAGRHRRHRAREPTPVRTET
jgi:CrcB protein